MRAVEYGCRQHSTRWCHQALSPTNEPTNEPMVSESRPNESITIELTREIRMIPPFFKLSDSTLPSFGRDFDTATASHEATTVTNGSATWRPWEHHFSPRTTRPAASPDRMHAVSANASPALGTETFQGAQQAHGPGWLGDRDAHAFVAETPHNDFPLITQLLET